MLSNGFVLVDQVTMLAYIIVHASYAHPKIARDATEAAVADGGGGGNGSKHDNLIRIHYKYK